MHRSRSLSWHAIPGLVFALSSCTCGGAPAAPSQSASAATSPASAPSSAAPPASAAQVPVAPAASGTPGAVACTHVGSGRDYAVGPGKPFANLGDVPFETLKAGDTVRIFWREQPYHEKLMISGKGTEKQPVRICGVPGPAGQLPVIDGQDATTRKQLDFPFDGHQVRGLVIIGHPHEEPWAYTPSYIVFEGIEVRNGGPPYSFTDRSGKKLPYSNIAAGIFVERANHLIIRGCNITANNNGLFAGTAADEVALTQNILVEGNHIWNNGSLADYYEHNVYNEASNVIYQFNRFGPPRPGKDGEILGANIKERSAGVVIRYNWIEDGAHILDIVDAQESKSVTKAMPSFHATHVYGNVIVRGTKPAGSMILYGGDSGVLEDYRKGTLFFYNNTVIVKNEGYRDYARTAIFELSTNDEHLDSRNNVYFSDALPSDLRAVGMLGARDQITSGVATFAGDWIRKGWTPLDLTRGGKVDNRSTLKGFEKMTRGESPGFRDKAAEDYALTTPIPAVALAPEIPAALSPTSQYVKHQRGKPRTAPLTVGALAD